jgi:molybdate/tungstate transport system substrate-binding protein
MVGLRIAYAGSLARLVEERLGPAWQEATGQAWSGTAGGSRDLARRLRRGELPADVFLSADEQVFTQELSGQEQGRWVAWYLLFATTELGLAFSPHSRFRPALEESAAGRRPWWDALQEPGLRFGRPDPDLDPKGYRTLFLFQLTEQTEGLSGLVERVLGPARNPAQIVPAADLFPRLRTGQLDVCPAYRSQAVEEGLPFLSLPEGVNLGHEEHAETYRQARYVSPDGAEYVGAPIRYAAAVVGDGVTTWAASFLVFLTQPTAQAACAAHGFHPTGQFHAL